MCCCWPKKTNQKSLGARPARPKRWGHPTEPHFPSNCTSDQRGVSCNNYTDPKSSLANSVEEENKRTKTTWSVKIRMLGSERAVSIPRLCLVSCLEASSQHHPLISGSWFCIVCWFSHDESSYSNVGSWCHVPHKKLVWVFHKWIGTRHYDNNAHH